MGAWGPGLFADDDAADVRDTFKLFVADKQDIAAATDEIIRQHGASLDHPEHNTAFWLSLALTQWTAGWGDARVLDTALRIIDDGSDLSKWQDPVLRRRRAAALDKAREQLGSPPPPAKPFPRPWPTQLADFAIGEIVARRLPNNRLAILKVIGFRPTREFKVHGPAVRLQHWLASDLPSAEEVLALTYVHYPLAPSRTRSCGAYVLTGPRREPLRADMFIRTGMTVPPGEIERRTSYGSISSSGVDQALMAGLERFWEDPTLPASAPPPWVYRNRSAAA